MSQYLNGEEIAAAGGVEIATGNYTGNNSVNRAIPHGLGAVPEMVMLTSQSMDSYYTPIALITPGYIGDDAVTEWDSTNFYVGNSSDYKRSANYLNYIYYWVAIA